MIVDHGLGNLLSVRKALEAVAEGITITVSDDPTLLEEATRIILPGVGNFHRGMENMVSLGFVDPLREAVIERKTPLLGICLGMQLLAEEGDEYGIREGLCYIPGRVRRIEAGGFELPHLGWDDIESEASSILFPADTEEHDYYFVHSYILDCPREYVLAWCDYGEKFPVAVQKENIYGVQFHPEKSRSWGLAILKNFVRGEGCSRSEWFLSSF